MKRVLLILCVSALASTGIASSGHAEQRVHDTGSHMQQRDGYTIRTVRLEQGSYGYEIRRGPVVLVHQRRNPFTGSKAGLSSRADAMKTAHWVLDHVVKREQMRPVSQRLPEFRALSRPIPRSVAATLGVGLDRKP